jgi:hypothetical protein
MRKKPLGIVLLAGALLAVGVAGIVAFLAVLPRNSNTSPLASLFALLWSCAYLVAAILTWRRSPFAPLSLPAAIGLLLFPASYLFPGGQFVLPSFLVIALVAALGYRYVRRHVNRSPIAAE